MIQRVILVFLITQSSLAFSFIRDYQTTRMISTSGAGTASILMIDAVSLNPATSAFFDDSLVYLQQNNGTLKNKNASRTTTNPYSTDPGGTMIAVSDGTTRSKGAGAYKKYEENDTERTRYSFNIASRVSNSTALGATYHYTQDENGLINLDDDFHRIDLGTLTFVSAKFSYGFTLKDVTNTENNKSTLTYGLQFVASKNVVFIGDIGFDYTRSLSGSFYYKVAAQVEFLEDLSFRIGFFDDKNTNLKGGSWGIMWNGPKLSIEGSMKKSRMKNDLSNYLFKDEKLTDISVALIVKI